MFHVKHSVRNTQIGKGALEALNALLDKNFMSLNLYAEQLLWWNQKINLVSRGVSRETILEHVKHSLLIATLEGYVEAENVIDAGTGGGLPGIPLAICYPEKEFLLNDIVSKKIMVVKQLVQKLKLKNVETSSSSIAEVDTNDALIITKHAFKIYELEELLKGSEWKKIIFLKGALEVEEELKKVKEPLSVNITHLDSTLKSKFYEGKSILEIERL